LFVLSCNKHKESPLLCVARSTKNPAAPFRIAAGAPVSDLVIFLVEWVWGSKFIEARRKGRHIRFEEGVIERRPHPSQFHVGGVITVVVIGDLVGIIVGVLLCGRIGLTSIDLVIIILVEWVWGSKSVKPVTFLCHLLGRDLNRGIITVVIIRDHVGIIVGVLLCGRIGLTSIDLDIIILVEWVWASKSVKPVTFLCHLLGVGWGEFPMFGKVRWSQKGVGWCGGVVVGVGW